MERHDLHSATSVPKVMDEQVWKESMNDKIFERTMPRIQGGSLYSTMYPRTQIRHVRTGYR